ncbi:hypothetical protein Bca4012_069721 [Brassica carinata]
MVGFKNRFMLMEVYLDPDKDLLGEGTPVILTKLNLSEAIKDSILVNFGECGLASCLGSFHVAYVNPVTKLCIVRSSRDEHRRVWSAMTLVRSVGNCPVVFNLLDISGCIRACRDAALKCETDKFNQFGKGLSEEEIREMNRKMRTPRTLEVWKLGTVNYLKSLKLQDKLVSERKANRIPDTLLSLQHPPTYTLGKRRTDHNLLIPEAELKSIGAELHYTQRGGDITFHGPHQAILYPILSLRSIGFGARSYVEALERSMIEFSSLYGVKARAGNKCETGVWVGDRKIGAIGVRISSGITCHGLAFNIDPDMKYFEHIVPCGIADKEVTSLRRETDAQLPSEEVIHEQLVTCLAKVFSYDDVVVKEDPSAILNTLEDDD